MGFPIFATRVKVGKGRDVVLISVDSPAGSTGKGEIESVEALRFIVSFATFAEITELFVRTLKTIDPALLKAVARAGINLDAETLAKDIPAETGVPSRKH